MIGNDMPRGAGSRVFLAVPLMLILGMLSLQSCSDSESRRSIELAVREHREDFETLLQMTLDCDLLQDYLHPEMPARNRLCLAGPGLPKDLRLTKHRAPVSVVSSADDCDNSLAIDSVTIADSAATVFFSYPIEGVRGSCAFDRTADGWFLRDSDLSEL